MAKDKAKKIQKAEKEIPVDSIQKLEVPSDLNSLSKLELTAIGKDLKIKNYSKMSKSELIAAINLTQNTNTPKESNPKKSTKTSELNAKTEVSLEVTSTETASDKTSDFEDLQRSELVEIAKNLKVKNYSRLNKSELLKAISKTNTESVIEPEVKIAETKKIDSGSNRDELQMPELIEIAKDLKIKNYSRLSKSRLIKAINQFKTSSDKENSVIDTGIEEVIPFEISKIQNVGKNIKKTSDPEIQLKDATVNLEDPNQVDVTESQAEIIEKIGKHEKTAYSDERETKVTEEETITMEEMLRRKGLIQPSKFSFGKTNEEFLLKDEESIVLPDLYLEEDKIVLLPVDPFKLFTYWDLNKKTLAMITDLGLSELYLKVNDVTGIIYNGNNPNVYWLEKCYAYSKDWYIYPNNSDRNLCVELGYIINGNFYLIARSNTIYIPPRQASNFIADTFVIVSYPKPEERTIRLDKEAASDKYISRSSTNKGSPYYQLNDYKMAENYNLKKLSRKMPVFTIGENIPEYFTKEFSMTGPQEQVTQYFEVNTLPPQKPSGQAPVFIPEFIEGPVFTLPEVKDNKSEPNLQKSESQPVIQNNFNNSGVFYTREYIIPSSQEITRIVDEIPESLISYFEYIPGFDKKNIKLDSFYYELPGENQKAIRVYYEWYEGETPYTREYFWISDVFPQVHENIYKVSWGPTWVKEFIGGSEHVRFIGASERFLGSSDIFLGGTERFIESSGKYSGGSELYLGSSDKFMGGSELFIGGSDKYLGGSDRYSGGSERFIGSSDIFMGASENFLGSSENFLGGSETNITTADRYKL